MTLGQKNVLVVVIALVGVVGWIAYGFLHTLRHIPEGHAAWDTGTLLVEYMKGHDNQWPRSWDELLTVLDSDDGQKIPLRGAQAGDVQYARALRETVTVDWAFDPASPEVQNPVAPRGGGKFSVIWDGAEPNEMIRAYLRNRASTRPSAAR
jgi:hypothetical protein